MPEEIWNKVDDYLDKMIVDQDHALLAALKDSEEADLPPINVSPPQGKMLHILARFRAKVVGRSSETLGSTDEEFSAFIFPD